MIPGSHHLAPTSDSTEFVAPTRSRTCSALSARVHSRGGDAHIAIRFYIARTYTQPELSSRRNYSLASIFCTTLIWQEAIFELLSLGCDVIKLISPSAHCTGPAACGLLGLSHHKDYQQATTLRRRLARQVIEPKYFNSAEARRLQPAIQLRPGSSLGWV